MYTLTKLTLEDGKDSLLPTGYSTTGGKINLFDWETNEIRHIANLNEIRTGWQVVLTSSLRDYHRTSKIRKIVSKTKEKIVFHTQTSLYQLTKTEEED